MDSLLQIAVPLAIVDSVVMHMVRKQYILKVFFIGSYKMVSGKEHGHRIISLKFQMIFICISVAILFLLYQHRLSEFNVVDTIPPLEDYNPESLAEFGGFYSKIATGLTIEEYQLFDIINNNFVIAGTLWFLVDPTVVDITTLGKFSFSQGTLLYVSPPATIIEGNMLFVQYKIRLQYSGNLEYTYFPLDEHRIAIRLTNTILTPQEAILVSEYRYFNILASLKPFGWAVIDKNVKYGYKTLFFDSAKTQQRDDDPYVEFIIDLKRTSYRYIISLIFPMLTFFYLSLFAFSVTGLAIRVSLPTVALTALISFRFIIERLSPAVGYFMLSDYLFFIFLAAIFMSFVFLVLDELSGGIPSFYRKMFIAGLHLLVIIFNGYFVL